jgi:hypothetical protein
MFADPGKFMPGRTWIFFKVDLEALVFFEESKNAHSNRR